MVDSPSMHAAGSPVTRRTALLGTGAALLAATTGLRGARAWAETPPVVLNGDFEAPTIGSTIPGWTPRYIGTDAQIVTSPVHGGAQALTITDSSTSSSAGMISDPIAITGGATYQIGGWAWSRAGSPSFLAYFYNAAGVQVGSPVTHIIRTATDSWNWESEVVTVPADAASARILLYSPTGGATRTTWDDVTVRPVARWTDVSVGHPITAPNVLDTSYGRGPDGRQEIYTVTAAAPGVFQVVDAVTGSEKARAELPSGASGSWTVVTASDGRIYIGVYNNGHVYRWDPASSTLSDLGRATPNCLYVWDLEEDQTGRLWGGTYPLGEVFSFDPATDTFTNYGAVNDEDYVRSVAIGRDGTVYAGTGSVRPSIVAIDPATGAKRDIPLPEGSDEEFVYHLDIRMDLLFTRVSPTSTLHVYDLAKGTWIDNLGKIAFAGVSPLCNGTTVYYVDAAGTLVGYDVRSRRARATDLAGLEPPRDFGCLHSPSPDMPGLTLSFMYQSGAINHYHLASGRHREFDAEVFEAPNKIQSQLALPDGRVVVGGYMYEGISVLDPATEGYTESPRGDVGQVEGMWLHGGDLYLGTYTRAHLYRWDYSTPWESGANPALLGSLFDYHQDRPFAWTSVGDLVVTGTVPGYGHLGGALAVIDPASNEYQVYPDPIPGQSIVALSSRGTTVYGSTSIHGGLGSKPSASAAVVFAWDLTTRSLLWQQQIGPEVRAVTSIKIGPDGRLWAVDVGRLVELDAANGQVLRSAQLMPYIWHLNTGAVWVGGDIEFTANGTMVVLSRGSVFEVDPGTLRFVPRASGVTNYNFTVHGESIYVARGDELFRLAPAP